MDNYIPIVLPSKCLVYPENTGISVRTFKGKDEKLMAELSLDNFEKKITTLLRGVLQGIDPEKLTTGDRMYILLWEAINSYSKNYRVMGDCLNCFSSITIPVDLSQIKVIELPDTFKEPYAITLSNGEIANLKLFRGADEAKIVDFEKNSKESSWLYKYALSLADDRNLIDKLVYLENLPAGDVAKIRAFHEKFYHGPDLRAKYVCEKCGGTGEVPVPFRLQMFFPNGEVLKRTFGDGI